MSLMWIYPDGSTSNGGAPSERRTTMSADKGYVSTGLSIAAFSTFSQCQMFRPPSKELNDECETKEVGVDSGDAICSTTEWSNKCTKKEREAKLDNAAKKSIFFHSYNPNDIEDIIRIIRDGCTNVVYIVDELIDEKYITFYTSYHQNEQPAKIESLLYEIAQEDILKVVQPVYGLDNKTFSECGWSRTLARHCNLDDGKRIAIAGMSVKNILSMINDFGEENTIRLLRREDTFTIEEDIEAKVKCKLSDY